MYVIDVSLSLYLSLYIYVCVCVCVCVCVFMCMCACAYVQVRERERENYERYTKDQILWECQIFLFLNQRFLNIFKSFFLKGLNQGCLTEVEGLNTVHLLKKFCTIFIR